MSIQHRGSCLCGEVRIEVQGAFEHPPEACHCTMCRKQTGHFLAGVNVRRSNLTILGEEHIGWYRSSDKVERGFCKRCGSTLFWKPNLEGYEWTGVVAGVFDTPIDTPLAKHTFVSDKGDYYEILDDAEQRQEF